MNRYRLGLAVVSRRWRLLTVVTVAALCVGVPAAYAALGSEDTAFGTGALASENGGDTNSAFGFHALSSNTSGSANTAVGESALSTSTTAIGNTAVGYLAMALATAHSSTAVGFTALFQATGPYNAALGQNALFSDTSGSENTAVGVGALAVNTTGSQNAAVGTLAGQGVGGDNPTGSDNTFLGYSARVSADTEVNNATAIGANAVVSQSDSLVLGASGVNVGINNTKPTSRLQIGAPSANWGDYIQLPIVNNTDKTPPVSDCNDTTYVGRMVVQWNGKKDTIWLCTHQGNWKKV